MDGLAEHVQTLAAPLADAVALDLVDVQLKGNGPARLVRVIVDRKGGVDLDRCQQLSRQLEVRLDALDELADGYALEVTSPGVDFPLRDRRAFDRVEGRHVLVHRDEGEGRVVQLEGTVRAAEAEAVVLEVGGTLQQVPYSEITKATQRLPW